MRKVKQYIVAIIALGVFTSCQDDDLTSKHPSGVDPEVAIINESTLETAVLGVYDVFQDGYSLGNYMITTQELLGDNGFVSIKNSNRFTDFNKYTYGVPSSASVSNPWTYLNRAIGRANVILSKEGLLTEDTSIKGTLKEKFAEAKFGRAYALFYLVNYYARSYGTINQDLGVPIPLKYAPGVPIKRSSVVEVYAQIEKDLLEVAAEGPEYNISSSTRFSKKAAQLLLSRVYLYKKDYQNAKLYGEKALEGAVLLAMEDVAQKDINTSGYYGDKSPKSETIFMLGFDPNDHPGDNDALFATWGIAGRYGQNFATTEFYSTISDTDVRKQLYRKLTSADPARGDDPAGLNVEKYKSNDQNLPYLRASEAQLNIIEALYYINPSESATQLNKWMSTYRDKSYNKNLSGQALLDEILLQRRIEFAFEGQRLFDLNRYQLPVVKGANCVGLCNIPFSDYRRVFPIPDNEMSTNNLMVQNPTYK